jgi:hypothetical protein
MNDPGGTRQTLFASSSDSKTSSLKAMPERWAIVLAGGDGSRLLPLTRKITGDDRPKQFCRIINGNTLLDITRKRVALSFAARRTLFSLTQKHAHYFNEALEGVPRENLVIQPRKRGNYRRNSLQPASFGADRSGGTRRFFPVGSLFL